ncbi:radical SAM family heme chaperone HemW [Sulfurospirillum arcachonense]|uniref:radical SAM family heme chaperone HemW n=1 Tax=Sulfurospirillum arcachonense TaxID=57666 RepID=UPI0004692BC8|nr:radical SAM family heme chaperone HemW [Sulfurospirillum arcachonense]
MLIYLHIPFCDSKCHYCAFNSYVDKFSLRENYMKAITVQLKKEIKKFAPKAHSIKSLFIGGGTPSTISPYMYEEFFDILRPYLKKDAEITTEANPNSASLEWLAGMKQLGVNRVSFGVQSFDEKKLQILGRNHSAKQAIEAINNAHQIGIQNISCDLIYATSFDVEEDIKKALNLPINHISSYALTLEENTPFYGKETLINNSSTLAQNFINQIAQKFEQYEISNFGNYQSVHNLGYWSGDDYIGIGAGAVGFLKDERYYPHKDIEEYIKNPLHVEVEKLTKEELNTEKIFLGLRSKIGISIDTLTPQQKIKTDILIKEKKLICKHNRLYNTNFLLSDEIALYIIS